MKCQKKPEDLKKIFSFRISPQNLVWLQQRAEEERRSVSSTLDLLLDEVRRAEAIIDEHRERLEQKRLHNA